MSRPLLALALTLILTLASPLASWAAPVSWVEVSPTAEGRQWWDEGSLRINRAGHLTVLSRFQPAGASDAPATAPPPGTTLPAAEPGPSQASGGAAATSAVAPPAAPVGALPAETTPGRFQGGRASAPASRLYVMELDCDQRLYRDISINGLPQFGASWQPTGDDDLTAEVLRQACAAEAA